MNPLLDALRAANAARPSTGSDPSASPGVGDIDRELVHFDKTPRYIEVRTPMWCESWLGTGILGVLFWGGLGFYFGRKKAHDEAGR